VRELYFYNAVVDRVVDGDTIDVTIDLGFNVWIKERLRLYGLNTPETRTKDAEEKERGLKAKRYVENQVNSNQGKIQIQSLGRGKYGRVLAEIWVGKNNINELLISNGHAEIYMTD
jgi:micrococcal nuclease